jgi:uncharacterized membrane protein YedE/YeeE
MGAEKNSKRPADNVKMNGPVKASQRTMSLWTYGRVLLVGTFFGVVLVKSEVVRWQRVHDMFLFKEAFMYLIIGTGIFVAMISMLLIKKLGIKTMEGQPIKYQPKPFHTGVIVGGMMFGAGWAVTGACPGPIYAQIGAGVWMALLTLLGAIAGTVTYAYAKPKLPH